MSCSSNRFIRGDLTKQIQDAYLAQYEADESSDLLDGWSAVKADDGRCSMHSSFAHASVARALARGLGASRSELSRHPV